MLYTIMRDTPVGPLTIAAKDGRICKVEFGGATNAPYSANCGAADFQGTKGSSTWGSGSADDQKVLELAVAQLEAYFRGNLREFTVPVELKGPAFQSKVWRHLTTIPYGQTEGYSQIARALENPLAARAVGQACAKNPVAIIVPCHRVLAQNGLGGFGGGLPAKRWLLKHEGYPLSKEE